MQSRVIFRSQNSKKKVSILAVKKFLIKKFACFWHKKKKKKEDAEVNSPVISNPAVRCEVGEPAKAIEPNVAPPSVPVKCINFN